jgi:hypothetical protein
VVARFQNAWNQCARSHHGGNLLSGWQTGVLDVHSPENTIVIDLHDERYNQLIVEVADPQAAVRLIQNAM